MYFVLVSCEVQVDYIFEGEKFQRVPVEIESIREKGQ
jgi:hypothetical protein